MKNIKLVYPSEMYQQSYLSFYQEWIDSKETMIPWIIAKDPSDFKEMLSALEANRRGENLPAGWVPDSTYWLVSNKSEVLGVVNIRHTLTDRLRETGGHIGYGIKPSARGKGYAVTMLKFALKKAKEIGMDSVLIVCDKENKASERTILKSGGRRIEDFIEEDGNVVHRFWIELRENS